jgi:hypothetical protein
MTVLWLTHHLRMGVGVGAGRIGADLHVFYNPLHNERFWKLGSATHVVNGQFDGPQVARIGGGFCGFGYFFFLQKKKKLYGPKKTYWITELKSVYIFCQLSP